MKTRRIPTSWTLTSWTLKNWTQRTLLMALLLAVLGNPAGAWGGKGHQITGYVARQHLEGTNALNQVRSLLKSGEDMGDACTWADRVKSGNFQEAKDFRAKYPKHKEWHYVDLPFQLTSYRLGAPGTRDDDVVQMMADCIRVLQGGSNPHDFTRRQALLLLVHYAGDIHQPLHVGCGYVSWHDGQFVFVDPTDPEVESEEVVVDEGGNALKFGSTNSTNLHGYWDTNVVNSAAGSRSPQEYAEDLVENVAVESSWNTSGNPRTWPKKWANDVLPRSRAAYQGLTILEQLEVAENDWPKVQWAIQRPDGYLSDARQVARLQLAKAGYRIAALLKAIWP